MAAAKVLLCVFVLALAKIETSREEDEAEVGNEILREVYQTIQAEEDEADDTRRFYTTLQVGIAPEFVDCKNKETNKDPAFPSSCFEGSSDTRLKQLDSLVSATVGKFRKSPGSLNVFSAPEWFFRKQSEAFSKDEMAAIIAQLKRMSKSYPGLLLAPGSIFWGVQDKNGKWIIFNCAPVLMNGRVVTFHCKSGEDDHLSYDEVWGPSQNTPLANNERASTRKLDKKIFEVGNLRMGMDICLDHTSNPVCFSNALPGSETLDVLLLEAASMHFHPDKSKISPGGVVIRCDGAQASANVGAQVLLNGVTGPCKPRTIFDEATNPLFNGWTDCASHDQLGSTPVDSGSHPSDLVYIWRDIPLLQLSKGKGALQPPASR